MLRQLRSLSFPVKETTTRAIASSASSDRRISLSYKKIPILHDKGLAIGTVSPRKVIR